MHRTKLVLAMVTATLAGNAAAVPFAAFDPRSLGMGGTGVSAATSGSAGYYNPALLAAAEEDEDFSLEVPVAGVRLADPDQLAQAAQDFQNNNYFLRFNEAFAEFTAVQTETDPVTAFNKFNTAKTDLANAGDDLINGLVSISDKAVELNANLGVVIGIPSKSYGMALTAEGIAGVGAVGEVADADRANMQTTVDAVRNASPTNSNSLLDIVTVISNITDPNTDAFSSSVRLRGAVVSSVGLSLGRVFNVVGQDLAIGITPKYMDIRTFEVKYQANQLDNTNLTSTANGERDYTGFNVDLGIARDYDNGWKTGLVVKNLIPASYDTAQGGTLDLNPMARLGVSHHTSRTTVAVDFDVTENDPIGIGNRSRYIGLGGELDVWLVKLRLGTRYDFSHSDSLIGTLGLGLDLFGLHLDAAVAGGQNEVAGSAQAGFRF